METRKNVILALAIATVFLIAMVGSASALPACPAPGNTDISSSCELTADYTVSTAGQYGYKITADNVVIDGKGYTLTGTMPAACGGGEAAPCTCAGVLNYDFDNVVVKDMEITGFCTGVVMGDNDAIDDVINMTVTGCKIHNCGELTGTTHGIHLDRANNCTISKNEIYEIDGTGLDGGCGGGGNGIFGYGGDYAHGNYGSVTCNYLHDNTKSGVFTKKRCQYWTFANNNASDNGETGIRPMCKRSNYCTIEYNIMTGNARGGYKSQASNNILRFNTITNNGRFGIQFVSDMYAPHGMNNEAYNNTICGHTMLDIRQVGDDDGTNKVDSNTCDNSNIAGACDWSCDTKVSIYYDFDGDGYYSDDDCSCTNPAGGKCACCVPGLFNSSGAAQHCAGGVCILTPGNDPNDCDADVVPPIQADVTIEPKTLNVKSNGKWISAYIELPEGYDVANIDLNTVCLDTIPAENDPQYGFVTYPGSYLMDHDGDGILERMVKFNRTAVIEYLGTYDFDDGDTGNHKLAELFVTGEVAGAPFEGSDTVRVRV